MRERKNRGGKIPSIGLVVTATIFSGKSVLSSRLIACNRFNNLTISSLRTIKNDCCKACGVPFNGFYII